eukprot:1276056-Rhodomonas_salina.1
MCGYVWGYVVTSPCGCDQRVELSEGPRDRGTEEGPRDRGTEEGPRERWRADGRGVGQVVGLPKKRKQPHIAANSNHATPPVVLD